MRRRSPDVAAGGYPPKLDVFDVNDWWVTDPEDPLELGYARICWHVARKEYAEGGDWESHMKPPAWWQEDDRKSQTRTGGQRQYVPDP